MMTKSDIKFIIQCIRKDTMSYEEKIHIENLLLAEIEQIEWLEMFKLKGKE